jgi:hypothetical protein
VKLFTALASTIVVAAAIFSAPILHYSTQESITFTVQHRERVQSDKNSRYMVWATFADDTTEVLENTDTFWGLKFNSADLYGRMQINSTCQATVTGLRIPVFSMNRNILSVSCVAQ